MYKILKKSTFFYYNSEKKKESLMFSILSHEYRQRSCDDVNCVSR